MPAHQRHKCQGLSQEAEGSSTALVQEWVVGFLSTAQAQVVDSPLLAVQVVGSPSMERVQAAVFLSEGL